MEFHFYHRERCFNTQPPEGGWLQTFAYTPYTVVVSTHSRLKAAGNIGTNLKLLLLFQHTAA